MSELLSIEELTKQYGHQLAVNKVSFTVQRGEICGLVGENGAGKITLLRILSGLIAPSSGSISKTKGYRMGALIESPALHPNLSAVDNLLYMAIQLNLPNRKEVIGQTLELVGLGDVDPKKKAKDFSLGMRQRLAIALAVLDRPDFLILDEPINGLDPVGIKEMRAIMTTLRDQFGMTILISSHILSELEMVVDRYIIMHQGKVLKELSKQALYQELEEQLYLQTQDNHQTAKLLKGQNLAYHLSGDYLVLPAQTYVMNLAKLLIEHNITFNEIFKRQISFEDFYLKLIQEGN